MLTNHGSSVIAPYSVSTRPFAIAARHDDSDHALTPQVDGMRHAEASFAVVLAPVAAQSSGYQAGVRLLRQAGTSLSCKLAFLYGRT